ncbi:DUF2399 domain-containing protein, partial [Streptomyces sp. NPDC008222]|uniref:DUF2399 domain-containing protein n=1 Tax=Streptomyces sp. NPDC008222 TaxID=3364820 RepID=UPI0036F053B4
PAPAPPATNPCQEHPPPTQTQEPERPNGVLLDALATTGCRFAYHGDFDWPGIALANRVIRHYEAGPAVAHGHRGLRAPGCSQSG